MRNGLLHDEQVAVLARQAVDLLAEDAEIRIEPVAGADPYRWGPRAWIVLPQLKRDHDPSIRVENRWTPAQALGRLMAALAAWVAETNFYWGVPYPICPGHEHSAEVVVPTSPAAEDVELRCPVTREIVDRVRPAL